MEQRMLIVVFNGNELPDEALAKVNAIVAKSGFAHPDDIVIHTLNEKDLAKIVAKQIIAEYSSNAPMPQTLTGDETIKMLSRKYQLSNNTSLAIQLTIDLQNIHDRMIHGKAIEADNIFVGKICNLVHSSWFHEECARKFGYVGETPNIVKQIYIKFFDKNGRPILR